jgi:ankyrin repeat protein
MVNHLLAAQANVNHETTTDGYIPPLVLAVENGHKSVTQHLLAAGVDINISDATLGKTLIQRALDRHDLEMSRMLMANGASVDRKLMEDYYTSELYTKVELGDLYTVALLLSWGAKVDEIHNEVPDTVLGAAISSGNCEMIQTLLQAEAKNTGRILIKIGNLKTAKYLEQLGMLPDILLLCGKHILVSAIHEESDRRGDGLVQYLLDHDVDRQVQPLELSAEFHTRLLDFSQSPLEEAINCQNVPLAKALVERGAPVTDFELTVAVQVYRCHRNYDFLSLLLCTLSQNPCAVPGAFVEAMQSDLTVCLIQRFLDAGLDPQGKSAYKPQVLEQAVTYLNGSTLKTLLQVTTWTAMEKGRALTVSLYYGHKHLVQDLLDAQADVNQVIGENTPLFLAVKMEDASLTRRLISAGANLNWLEVGYGPTILESAVYIGNKQIVKVLLDAGADVNHPASLRWGHTSLQIAVKEGDIQLVDMLLDAGADVNQPASRVGGQTALQIAVQEGNVQLVNILLDAGADVNQEPAKDRGATALQFAAIQGYIGIAHKLLDRGADVNAAKSIYHGRSALEGAAEHGRIDMLQLLLNERASIEGPGRIQYIRAIKLAEKLTNYAAAQLLRDHGGWNDSDARQYEHELFDRDEQLNIKGRFKNGG